MVCRHCAISNFFAEVFSFALYDSVN